MLDACFRMAPFVKHDKIHCIFCDEFLADIILIAMKLNNVSLFFDHYHLNLKLKNKCGPCLYIESKDNLKQVLLYLSEDQVESRISLLNSKFPNHATVK